MAEDQPQSSASPAPKVLVAQLGSRMHYAVPIAFHRAKMLALFVTDITAKSTIARLSSTLPRSLQPRILRRLMGRTLNELPNKSVHQFPIFGLWIGVFRKFAAALGRINDAYLWIGRNFARRAARLIPPETKAIYCFNGASLELLNTPIAKHKLKILEQTMAPRVVEDRLLREAQMQFPGWAEPAALHSSLHRPELYHREAAEWAAADVIVCGSQFVVDGIAEAGGPTHKCKIVPYGINPQRFRPRARQLSPKQPLRLLFVGAVTLRKGAPIVLEVAKELAADVDVRMVGAIQVPQSAEQMLREHVELIGPVPRVEMVQQFDWADVFILPSYCEGSATVTYEAMASGLPQIVTANTGSYVVDGREGHVVQAGNVAAIVDAVRNYISDPETYKRASLSALESVHQLTLTQYQERLVNLVREQLQDHARLRRSSP